MPSSIPPRPPFSSLPLDKHGPPMNAWGLYGKDDELGALNMITPDVVKEAAKEIQTGERVSLDWRLDLPTWPSFGRPRFGHEIRHKAPRTVNDDELHFNTQCSTQWDGFRHYGYQKSKKYYGGRSQEEVHSSEVIGIDRIANIGGLTTRAIILDYPEYCSENGIPVSDPLSATSIPLSQLKEMLSSTGLTPRAGDLLLLRVGFTAKYLTLSANEQENIPKRPEPYFLGIESSREVCKWIWENGFVAVASDAPSLEMSPLVGKHNAELWKGEAWAEEMQGGGLIHQWLLAGWGVMIGEMFDLEALVTKAKELGRSSCFVSSVPLKVPGGVASPPNAVAIF